MIVGNQVKTGQICSKPQHPPSLLIILECDREALANVLSVSRGRRPWPPRRRQQEGQVGKGEPRAWLLSDPAWERRARGLFTVILNRKKGGPQDARCPAWEWGREVGELEEGQGPQTRALRRLGGHLEELCAGRPSREYVLMFVISRNDSWSDVLNVFHQRKSQEFYLQLFIEFLKLLNLYHVCSFVFYCIECKKCILHHLQIAAAGFLCVVY